MFPPKQDSGESIDMGSEMLGTTIICRPQCLVVPPSVLFWKGAKDLIDQNGVKPSCQIGHGKTLDIQGWLSQTANRNYMLFGFG
ncbi:hypothetical protein A2Y83_02810 [Candidatus Falkowbacteria bacterium RBG_13_39_14]|uniref:Uncharacterized protein n=1 Tax=Candidatus Falkowbacteria bacterium RBG_13_39_14 TaxID=1797985 RepID=A0A1F5S3E1_9BACT|nr:MAG: hypothetical protein A2Y83_02810 [Candidatus Falkowbacteria bacterium RBG_13_39_14]